MRELVNLSNAACDNESLLGNAEGALGSFLREEGPEGVELLPCGPWNPALHPASLVYGVHLRYWPSWAAFFLGNGSALRREFPRPEDVRACYGADNPEAWLSLLRAHIREALAPAPEYLVFHVADAPSYGLYTRRFPYDDITVTDAAAALLNEVTDELPEGCLLLLENLWWPGLTLTDPEIAERLLRTIHHRPTGFMLDTGHLMHTEHTLSDEEEAAEYVVRVYRGLGSLGEYVKGLHLHQSLTGDFVRRMMREHGKEASPLSPEACMDYVLATDPHLPFRTSAARRIMEAVRPDYLVHEFMAVSRGDWREKLRTQRRALGFV